MTRLLAANVGAAQLRRARSSRQARDGVAADDPQQLEPDQGADPVLVGGPLPRLSALRNNPLQTGGYELETTSASSPVPL